MLNEELATKNLEIAIVKKNLTNAEEEYEKNLAYVTSEQAVINQIRQDHQAQVEKMNADWKAIFNDSKAESDKKLEISKKLMESIKKKS